MNRDEKSQKKPRKMDQSLIREAEYNNLLKILEKNLAISQEYTYADRKAVDTEVSASNETVLQEIISLMSHHFSVIVFNVITKHNLYRRHLCV